MLVRESAYADGSANTRHSAVEMVEVTTLMRSENSTSSERIASPKCATPPATMPTMALPTNSSTNVATTMDTAEKTSRLRPRCFLSRPPVALERRRAGASMGYTRS